MIWPVMRVGMPVDTYEGVNRLYRDMERLFGDYSGSPTFPAVNAWNDANEAVVSAELPGMDTKDVNVSVEDNVLTIEGERKSEPLDESDIQVRCERPAGRFSRSFRLPFDVEVDKIVARYENGLLNIRLPRREATRPRKIEIAVG